MRLPTVSSCSGQSLVSSGVDQPRPRPAVEADRGVDSEGGVRSGAASHHAWSSWGHTEVAPEQRWPGTGGGCSGCWQCGDSRDTHTRPGTGDLMVYYH